MLYGQEGILYGTDGTIDIREITGFFRGNNLAGKPKMFIFQACQGKVYYFFYVLNTFTDILLVHAC